MGVSDNLNDQYQNPRVRRTFDVYNVTIKSDAVYVMTRGSTYKSDSRYCGSARNVRSSLSERVGG